MVLIKRLILMIQFLTIIPLPAKFDAREEDYGKGLAFAPFAGLILGGIMMLLYSLLEAFFPDTVLGVIILVIYIVLTGGLHFDGLGDTFDGLFSNRSKEKMLEIMRDSRVGTNAVLAIISVFALDTVLLASIDTDWIKSALILMPVAGRMGSLLGAGISVYARNNGLGKSFIDYCGIKEIIIGAVIHLTVFYLVLGYIGLITGILTILSAFLTVRLLTAKLGGATGDILGAVCELNQTAFLVL
ncbi:MAG: adenosylcobinamide-GDP ribazoletransferase, partial [Clostridiaceae bacterium]|nr:adenosylcobinamide-GDP ribazoletransferase [Clostridiaceae bacterium]